MKPLFIPSEKDSKKWVRRNEGAFIGLPTNCEYQKFATRRPAKPEGNCEFFTVSLVTLTHWTKRGLPSHKQGGRIYFDKKRC